LSNSCWVGGKFIELFNIIVLRRIGNLKRYVSYRVSGAGLPPNIISTIS
jgi:hypothetical protein